MRHQSPKSRRRAAAAKPVREALIASVGKCECCGHYPEYGSPGTIRWALCCHEIANGQFRQECLDKRYGLLCVCWYCNSYRMTDKKAWPVARQLAILKASRPGDYSLEDFCRLIQRAPGAITEEDVDQWMEGTR